MILLPLDLTDECPIVPAADRIRTERAARSRSMFSALPDSFMTERPAVADYFRFE
jgi:hypothetical protein